ncbi:sensor histidine kinase [Agromyces sp. NPDC057679]|uniref:sensor histidine kinase n=1 Tax=Agromyces sp. NPDC057679 TaxID=3346207 RepID=UPI00366D41A6
MIPTDDSRSPGKHDVGIGDSVALVTAEAAAQTEPATPTADRLRRQQGLLLGRLVIIAVSAGTVAMAAAFLASTHLSFIAVLAALVLISFALAAAVLFVRFDSIPIAVTMTVLIAAASVIASTTPIGSNRELGITVGATVTAPSIAISLMASRRGVAAIFGCMTISLVAVGFAVIVGGASLFLVMACTIGWATATLVGAQIVLAVNKTEIRLAEVDAAYDAEHAASVIATRKRQEARLLHDTVLATLSLVAHGGRGVDPDSLRRQADVDSRMLKNLRLTGVAEHDPTPFLKPVPDEFELGVTFESVRHRFAGLGLSVNWHGEGKLVAPKERIDALVGAVGECLENVRRHSGVDQADVTVSSDDGTIRAMVTDQGSGFDQSNVKAGKLGFAESIVGRLESVGGRVRVFSSPGAGTTIMLEVPR